MLSAAWIALALHLWGGQINGQPAHVREGDQIEQQFRSHQSRLEQFFSSLRAFVLRQLPAVRSQLPELEDPPPPPVVYGYGLVPRIVDTPDDGSAEPIRTFSYSWPTTAVYIDGETLKLDRAEAELSKAREASGGPPLQTLTGLILEYRDLVRNQRTIDQYIQYNRFWQRAIAADRPRFDQLTRLYELMKAGEPDVTSVIREILGRPEVPLFIQTNEPEPGRILLTVPVYTDIADEEFLVGAKRTIEEMWQVRDSEPRYELKVQWRYIDPADLYRGAAVPEHGARFEITSHAERFPSDGAVLTTGAQTTHSRVGRYVALGPGDLSGRTLAHEFGHVLGFRDGYIRGYRDLAERGFEILELTPEFDDIMSAPRQGRVQPTHFKLIVEALTALR